ncbi:unnamed protein product [Phyllotreta striolata]|uniref:Uncharacterized protein n=1 Tax=Phyllotreta striolata TaxID=444603 RepID=A0A9N9TE48_PHYSR|nr:unnamed protein product [Phyllotreta striolata]
MKFAVCTIFLTFAVASSLAALTLPSFSPFPTFPSLPTLTTTTTATCTNCPATLGSISDLVRNAQAALSPFLSQIPFGFGNFINGVLSLIIEFFSVVEGKVSIPQALVDLQNIISRIFLGGSLTGSGGIQIGGTTGTTGTTGTGGIQIGGTGTIGTPGTTGTTGTTGTIGTTGGIQIGGIPIGGTTGTTTGTLPACTSCPDSLAAVTDLLRNLENSLLPILDKLPLNLGYILKGLLDLLINLLSTSGNGLSGDLSGVLQQLGGTLQTLLGGGL